MRLERSANIIGPWNYVVIDERCRGQDLAGAPPHATSARDDVLQMERCAADSAYSHLERQEIAEHRWPREITSQMHCRRPDLTHHDQLRPWKADRRPEFFDDTVEDVQVGREVGDPGGIAISEPELAIE